MSKFPAQIVDLTVDRELFDHTGSLPPTTRLTVEMPPEYIRKQEPGAKPPYSDGGIDQNVLADIRAAVMRKYGGIARQCLRSFRQDVSLGEMAFNSRMTRLGAGVGMNYVSQFGNELINIHVNEEGVRKLIGKAEDLYMLILYGGNRIAAISMEDVYARKFELPAYTAVLSNSSWVYDSWIYDDTGKIVQEQLSVDMSAISTTLTIGSENITISDRRIYDNDLKFSVMSDATIITGGRVESNVRVYTEYDIIKYNKSSGFVRIGDAPGTLDEAGGGYLSPTGAMDPNRTDYTYNGFDYAGPVTTNFMNTAVGGGLRKYSPPDKFTLIGNFSRVGYSQNYTYLASTISTSVSETVWSIYGYTYSTFTQTYVINYPVFPIYHNTGDNARFISFPYPVRQKPYYTLGHMNQHGGDGAPSSDNSTYEFVTPHERLDTTANTVIRGKWNLHNGGVLIQCVDVWRIDIPDAGIERVIYINGRRVTSIAGVAANEIEAAFIDIPMDKIKKYT